MSLQPLFRKFHELIQLKQYDQNAELRQKRDILLGRLRDKLRPRTFEFFNQGSYAMGTGIKPSPGSHDYDYDMDIGLVFDLDHRTTDPHSVKEWVYQALFGHTQDVQWRTPCITVNYREAREPKYHVDLAVMAREPNGALHLALCPHNAQANLRKWQPDGRQKFIQAIQSRFDNSEDDFQFRRVVRFLKRWKNEHFPREGRAAPSGLSLTVAAHQWFRPVKQQTRQGVEYDDLLATAALVDKMRQGFQSVRDGNGQYTPRLILRFPFEPHDDVLTRMSHQQMSEFLGRLEKLSGWLEEARRTQNAAPLRRAFGEQFPIA
ncbi:nucleotidyltransferase [Cystobacter fuscus]|uniref:nucleotidyltransferase domain-containing protein n=1 Tax=Cystobacter fuscus TaxID=43 RepID=UPI002B2E4672|nr:nucleotidyltransferase [Cystobacter fuscus]